MNTDLKVTGSTVRCPYCHDDIEIARTDWIACRDCLARNHTSCWEFLGACASCSGEHHLAEAGPRDRYTVIAQRIESEIARADSEWAKMEAVLGSRVVSGRFVEPSPAAPYVWSILGCLGLAWTVATALDRAPFPVPFMGIVCLGVSAMFAIASSSWSRAYRTALAKHEARRGALVAEFDELRRSSAGEPELSARARRGKDGEAVGLS